MPYKYRIKLLKKMTSLAFYGSLVCWNCKKAMEGCQMQLLAKKVQKMLSSNASRLLIT